MSTQTPTSASGEATLVEQSTISAGSYVSDYWRRVRSGDLGALPIVVGLIVIAIIFQTQNQNFLTSVNFVNLILQTSPFATIAIGVVFVLLLGEIDLSIGYVSAVVGVSMTLLLLPPYNLAWYYAIPAALAIGAVIGLTQGWIITFFQLPAFIVTLAGFLVWNGVVLIMVGAGGTIVLQNAVAVGIANYFLPQVWGWVFAAVIIIGWALAQFVSAASRRNAGLSAPPLSMQLLQIVVVGGLVAAAVYVCNLNRGVPAVGVLVVVLLALFSYVASRTPFGRYVYAVGGNREAARRAGIPVDRIRILVFMISSLMAGVGGIILASRLRSVATNSGGGNLVLNCIAAAVIGGTSLFGGSGRVVSALLGALVVAGVENGMGLLGLSAGVKFIVTGLVLLLAVLVDALARRRRTRSGLA